MSIMNLYIENVIKRIKEGIDEKDLEFIANTLIDLIHYAIILKEDNLIFIASIMKDIVIDYSMILDEYILPEDFENRTIDKVMNFIEQPLNFLDKSDFTHDDIIWLFNWNKTIKNQIEKDMYLIRSKKKFKQKKINEFVE